VYQCITISQAIFGSGDSYQQLRATLIQKCDQETGLVDFYGYEKIVLDFLIRKREKAIEKVRETFKLIDHDDDGVLDQIELENTLSCIDPTNKLKLDRREFVAHCDPWNSGVINFSTFIKVLGATSVRIPVPNPNYGAPSQPKEIWLPKSLIRFSKM